VMAWIVSGISSFYVGSPSSSGWSGGVISWYGVYGSSTIYHWRELIVYKVLDCNRWPAVPGVYYPDRLHRHRRGAPPPSPLCPSPDPPCLSTILRSVVMSMLLLPPARGWPNPSRCVGAGMEKGGAQGNDVQSRWG
jgi:hypothetical protein